jgi:hypothetical protein
MLAQAVVDAVEKSDTDVGIEKVTQRISTGSGGKSSGSIKLQLPYRSRKSGDQQEGRMAFFVRSDINDETLFWDFLACSRTSASSSSDR